MPRFTVKDLLIATTLIAVGAGMLAFLINGGLGTNSVGSAIAWAEAFLLWFGGSACIGAGLLSPFKRRWTGAVLAIVIQMLFVVLYVLIARH
jgi:hypothetical protein